MKDKCKYCGKIINKNSEFPKSKEYCSEICTLRYILEEEQFNSGGISIFSTYILYRLRVGVSYSERNLNWIGKILSECIVGKIKDSSFILSELLFHRLIDILTIDKRYLFIKITEKGLNHVKISKSKILYFEEIIELFYEELKKILIQTKRRSNVQDEKSKC